MRLPPVHVWNGGTAPLPTARQAEVGPEGVAIWISPVASARAAGEPGTNAWNSVKPSVPNPNRAEVIPGGKRISPLTSKFTPAPAPTPSSCGLVSALLPRDTIPVTRLTAALALPAPNLHLPGRVDANASEVLRLVVVSLVTSHEPVPLVAPTRSPALKRNEELEKLSACALGTLNPERTNKSTDPRMTLWLARDSALPRVAITRKLFITHPPTLQICYRVSCKSQCQASSSLRRALYRRTPVCCGSGVAAVRSCRPSARKASRCQTRSDT